MDIIGFGEKQQKILQYLVREKQGMTIDQLTKLLGISRTATYQHIAVLERDGYIKKHTYTQTKGRPGAAFVLTENGINLFPKHYSLFAELLIKMIKSKLGSNELIEYLQELGASLADSKKQTLKNKTLNERIEQTVIIMQELGYAAEMESNTSENEPVINAYNCVFHDLAKQNQEVCKLDISLISTLLDTKIEHTCCMTKGDACCSFKVLNNLK